MAQLDVEPKKNNDWWKWLLGILAIAIIIWIIIEALDTDEIEEMDDMEEPLTEDTSSLLKETEFNKTIEYHRV